MALFFQGFLMQNGSKSSKNALVELPSPSKSKNGVQSDPKRSKKSTKAIPSGAKERPRRPQVTPRRPQSDPKESKKLCLRRGPGPGVPVRGKEFLRRLRLSAVKTDIKQFYTTLQDKSTITIDSTATCPTRTGVPEGHGADL